MTTTSGEPRADFLTVAALAITAACVSTIAHEAVGHGSACLLRGGQINRLTSVYFQCEPGDPWIAAAGPAMNLFVGLGAWLLRRLLPAGHPRLRWLLLLVMAFSLFWEAGYMIYAMVLDEGDWAIALRGVIGDLPLAARVAVALAGAGLYVVAARLTAAGARAFDQGGDAASMLRQSWLAAAIAACVAAAFYAPDQAAIRQAALEIGAASSPLLLIRPRGDLAPAREAPVARSYAWIIAAGLLYAAFVATLGRGLP